MHWSMEWSLYACWFMTGVIWIVQLVHYPAFDWVDPERFREFTVFHSQRITWVVMPVMLIEMMTAVWSVLVIGGRTNWMGLGILVGVWLATFLFSVPCHNRLAQGFDEGTFRMLVYTNWFRTFGWTARALLLTSAKLNFSG